MKELSACPQDEAEYVAKGRYRGAIVDPKTNQRLEFAGDDPFVVFTLDHDDVEWGAGKKPDGVLVVDIDGKVWVCFIEVKGRSNVGRAFDQLEGGAVHFCPAVPAGGERTHGDEHHEEWSAGRDKLKVLPAKDHRSVGLFVTFRTFEQPAPRPPPQIGGRPFVRRAVQVPREKPYRAEINPRALLKKAGLLG